MTRRVNFYVPVVIELSRFSKIWQIFDLRILCYLVGK